MAMLNNQRVMVVLWKQHLIQIERGLLSLRAFSPKKKTAIWESELYPNDPQISDTHLWV